MLGFLLEEACPVVLDVCFLHHHRKDHLGVVAVHLGSCILGIILGEEGLPLAGVDLEHVGSNGACDRSADLAFGSPSRGSDEHRIDTLACKGGEHHIDT